MTAYGQTWTKPLVVEDILEAAQYLGVGFQIDPNMFGINYLIGNPETGYINMYDSGRGEPKVEVCDDPAKGTLRQVYSMYTVESTLTQFLPSMNAGDLIERGDEVDAIRSLSASRWTLFESAELTATNMVSVKSRKGSSITYAKTTKVYYRKKEVGHSEDNS